jgi:hypothetical protein
MTQTVFTDNVLIDGSQDTEQLRVQATVSQTDPLQTWENSAGGVLGQVTGDGRLELGKLDLGTPDALIEANQAITLPSAVPPRGVQSQGRVSASTPQVISDGLAWSVHELELLGNAVISGIHAALRGRVTRKNTASSPAAELRAADFEAINDTESGANAVNTLTGVRSAVTNEDNAQLTEAVGTDIEITNGTGAAIQTAYGVRIDLPASANKKYALHANAGSLHLGDDLELKVFPAAPTDNPPADFIKLYPKLDGSDPKLYAKDSSGVEYEVSGSVPLAGLCNGRLTLSSGVPVPTSDITAATTVYFAPYGGNQVSLYDGSQWNIHSGSEISLKLTDTQNGTTTNGSAVITGLTNTAQFIVGMNVSGTGIPANSIIQSINSATQITLNQNATASGTAPLTFTMPANTPFDIFIYDNAGVLALEAVAWTAPDNGTIASISNATPRVVTVSSHTLSTGQLVTIAGNSVASNNATWRVGTTTSTTFRLLNLDGSNSSAPGSVGNGGTWQRSDQNTARATLLALQDGVYVKSGAAARRYLGTIRTTNVAGQCEDSTTKRLAWNYYQRVMRQLLKTESVNSWTWNGASWRCARSWATNRVEVVVGVAEASLELSVHVVAGISSGAGVPVVGIGEDTIANNSADIWHSTTQPSGVYAPSDAVLHRYPFGYHYYQWVEYCGNPGTAEFYSNLANMRRSGMKGWVWG